MNNAECQLDLLVFVSNHFISNRTNYITYLYNVKRCNCYMF